MRYRSDDWQRRAACGNADPDLFTPVKRGRNQHHATEPNKHPNVIAAKEYCAVCPVIDECAAFARSQTLWPATGVWGGDYITDHEARLRLVAARRRDS